MAEDEVSGGGRGIGQDVEDEPEVARGARLVRRAPRTARALDPHGIYDARSAARRRLARQRRSLSSALMLGAACVAGGAFILGSREPRVPGWPPLRVVPLAMDVAALSALPDASAPGAGAASGSRALAVARDGRVAILDAGGQARSWDASDFPLSASATLARGLVIVGGQDGDVRAFELASRRLRWRARGDSPISCRAVFLAAASTSREAPSTPLPPTVPASASLATPGAAAAPLAAAPPRAASPSALAQDSVVVGDDGGLVRALRLSDGKLLWSTRLGAPCGGGLSASRVSGGRVLVFVPLLAGAAQSGGLAALNARDGRLAWRYPRDERLFAAVATAPLARAVGGRMRLFCADDAGAVSARDAAPGRSPSPRLRSGSPASTSAGGEWKTFLAPMSVPGASGGGRPFWKRWSWTGGGSSGAQSEPMLVSVRADPLWLSSPRGPVLAVAGNDGGVRALDARSGRLLWSADTGEAPIALLKSQGDGSPAGLAVVTPHAVELRDVQDGRRRARFEWGDAMGRAQAAATTRGHLFVAGRQLAIFAWSSAP